MAEKFIGDYVNGLDAATSSQIATGNSLLLRDSAGNMKKLDAGLLASAEGLSSTNKNLEFESQSRAANETKLQGQIAPTFSTETAYSKGDLVAYLGGLYEASEDMEAGEWDDTKWTETTVKAQTAGSVKSTTITNIVKVSALPETPDENTLYIVVEEATTTSETDEAATASETEA